MMSIVARSISLLAPLADPTQQDVLKSISDNVREPGVDGRSLAIVVLCVVGVLLLLVLANLRLNRTGRPKVLNHYGKLMKELARRLPLKSGEMKQLKILSQVPTEDGRPVANPLVMVLCPSLMTKALGTKSVKVDRKILAGLARKMGLIRHNK